MSRLEDWTAEATPIDFVDKESWPIFAETLPPAIAAFARACGFDGKSGAHLLAPGPDGALAIVLFGVEASGARHRDAFLAGKLATLLPPGLYRLREGVSNSHAAALAFLLGGYSFSRYLAPKKERPRLCAPQDVDRARIERIAAALSSAAISSTCPPMIWAPRRSRRRRWRSPRGMGRKRAVMRRRRATSGKLPAIIHAVGRAAAQRPGSSTSASGREEAMKVTLVGKGVCFDSGGLDIKPSSGMLLMKKDMGGAATALGARPIFDGVRRSRCACACSCRSSRTPFPRTPCGPATFIRAARASLSRSAIRMPKGASFSPTLWLSPPRRSRKCSWDFATLTGAARVALGPELPAFYTGGRRSGAGDRDLWPQARRSGLAPAVVGTLIIRSSTAERRAS